VIPAYLKHLWVQIDEDLMAWFRQQGEDWPARINAALREHVEARRKAGKTAGRAPRRDRAPLAPVRGWSKGGLRDRRPDDAKTLLHELAWPWGRHAPI
jgi:hypothetical protein